MELPKPRSEPSSAPDSAPAPDGDEAVDKEGVSPAPGGEGERDDGTVREAMSSDDLRSLRTLLLGREQQKIEDIAQQVSDLKQPLSAAEISALLPEAIELQSKEGLTPALLPAVERVINESVKEHPEVLTDAIFPILGPMIRKSVSVALERMSEQTQFALDHAFSLRSWRWRMEARATGKSFEQVVLLHSLVYRVEQVFLIHLSTGLLLLHVSDDSVKEEGGVRDADLVSGMLTAIQDFVRDSFQTRDGEVLETVQVGELTVWIERGPHAVVASVVRGKAPHLVREQLRAALERCHKDYPEPLRHFEGDAAVFEGMRPHLLSCLHSQYHPEKKSAKFPIRPVLLLLLLGITGLVARSVWREHEAERRWQAAVSALAQTPGIVITSASRTGQHHIVQGLRDPAAEDAQSILDRQGLSRSAVEVRLAPYFSLDRLLVERRIYALLRPPESVRLTFDGAVLTARGAAPSAWLGEARLLVRAIPGLSAFHDEVKELRPAPELGPILARVNHALQAQHVAFEPGMAELKPDQDAVLAQIAEHLSPLKELPAESAAQIEISIIGYANQSPEQEAKNHLGERRARALIESLRQRGVEPSQLRASGMGAVNPASYRNGVRPVHPENSAIGILATIRGSSLPPP